MSLFAIGLYAGNETKFSYELEEQKIIALPKGKKKITKSIYETRDFTIRYGKKAELPKLDFNQDLSKIDLLTLRMLKYELYARKGYLFEDVVIRDYFNQQKWYQPIYWIDSLDFSLNKTEKAFYKKIKKQEQILLKALQSENAFDLSKIANLSQLDTITEDFKNKISKNGYVVVKQNNIELFETYENNNYAKMPSFVTTDVYLQLIHLYFSFMLQSLEEEKFIPMAGNIIDNLYKKSMIDLTQRINPESEEEAKFAQFYFAIAKELLTGERLKIDSNYEEVRTKYLQLAKESNQQMLDENGFIDFSLFKPRGNYTKTKELSRYFQTVMWFGKFPFKLEKEMDFKRAKYIAKLLASAQEAIKDYKDFSESLGFLIGDPENLSILDLANNIDKNDNLIKETLIKINPAQLTHKGRKGNNDVKLMFFPQLFTPDARILNGLIHLSRDEQRREFPRTLDVFATFGNKAAENILLNYYDENKKWVNYLDSLTSMKNLFQNYDLKRNAYSNWIYVLNSLNTKNDKYPKVMQLDTWDAKNLNTGLASYAELKHDAILYAEQASGAEAGEGDNDAFDYPNEPTNVAYIEPNIKFWDESTKFTNKLSLLLIKLNVINENLSYNLKEINDLGDFCNRISKKEINRSKITQLEYDSIIGIGRIFEDLHLSMKIERERKTGRDTVHDYEYDIEVTDDNEMAVVADIFTTNETCLEVGVGRADDIYVIVEIDGYNYLTRGSVFSFYEFEQPVSNRLTDSEWRTMLNENKEPKREGWYLNYLIDVSSRYLLNNLKYNPSSFKEYTYEEIEKLNEEEEKARINENKK